MITFLWLCGLENTDLVTLFTVVLPKEKSAKRCWRRVTPTEAITGNPGKALSEEISRWKLFFTFFFFSWPWEERRTSATWSAFSKSHKKCYHVIRIFQPHAESTVREVGFGNVGYVKIRQRQQYYCLKEPKNDHAARGGTHFWTFLSRSRQNFYVKWPILRFWRQRGQTTVNLSVSLCTSSPPVSIQSFYCFCSKPLIWLKFICQVLSLVPPETGINSRLK